MKHILSIFLMLLTATLSAQVLKPQDISGDFEELMGKNHPRWRYVDSPEERAILSFYEANYERLKDFQFAPGEDFKIPKKIHLIWLGQKSFPLASIDTVRSWLVHHPDWDFYFWTDRERILPINGLQMRFVDQFSFRKLKKHYLEATNWSEKADILRLEILAQEGGIYMDHDAFCLRPFDTLNQAYDFYACLEAPHAPIDHHNITAGIGLIGSRPEHPIILGAIDAVLGNWDRFTKQFSTTDALSQLERVMHRTYIALSHSLMKNLDSSPYKDIVFPAAYFYPLENMQGIYSKHLYATSWNFYGETTKPQFVYSKMHKPFKKMTYVVALYTFLMFSTLFAIIIAWKATRRMNQV